MNIYKLNLIYIMKNCQTPFSMPSHHNDDKVFFFIYKI